MTPKVILISGKKRVGKNYFANLLQEELEKSGKTSEIIAFATPIKEIFCELFGLSMDLFEDLKNNESYKIHLFDKEYNFRQLLQKFGTDIMQKYFGELVWVQQFIKRACTLEVDYVIVPDFRFLHEDVGDFRIKIINNTVLSNDNHRSETEIDNLPYDYLVDNTGYKPKEVLQIDVENIKKMLWT